MPVTDEVVPVPAEPPEQGVQKWVVRRDLSRNLLAVLLLGALIVGSFWILRPFLLPMLWAGTIVIATWPAMLWLQARLRRRAFAVTVMTTLILLIFIVPVALAVETLISNADTITGWISTLASSPLPMPPEWVKGIPMVGERIAQIWADLAEAGKQGLLARAAPYAGRAAQWGASLLGGIGIFLVQLSLCMVFVAIFYAGGETVRGVLIRFGQRLAGEQGSEVVLLAGRSVRAVALGVVGTALAQTILAGIGLAVTGVPFASLLAAIILVLCIAQVGPVIVLLPALGWLYWNGQPVAGTVLLVWTVVVGTMDNVLRPLLIRAGGANLPLLLIFGGVIGGLIAFGIVGLFVGPVVLAIAYTLLLRWLEPPTPR